mmetsp:Transcript_9652/g.43913  ORF Transcript_9652/g.43913 Transcript_9652/m.43913 type:complete len:102 (+) Transcript_9652:1750-2055(+)
MTWQNSPQPNLGDEVVISQSERDALGLDVVFKAFLDICFELVKYVRGITIKGAEVGLVYLVVYFRFDPVHDLVQNSPSILVINTVEDTYIGKSPSGTKYGL